MKKHFLFVALFFAALSIGFIACDNDDDPRLDNDKENAENNIENVVDDDSTEDNIEGEEDYYSCDSTEIVCTGKAYETTSTFTKIAATVHVPTTLLGQCTLGIQFSENLNDLEEHENVKSFTTSNLTGNDYIVKLKYLRDNTTYYYCAYVYLNGVYHYGLIRSFKTLEYDKIDGHAYVDLGLPSGLKWATCNVGATKPEEYGDYFAWGEVEPKEVYNWNTYKWATATRHPEYNFLWNLEKLTKYNTNSDYGTVDNKTVLDPEDDAASVNMGGSWRMPTFDEIKELINECTWTWTSNYNGTGIAGRIVTSKINGNSIFLPAAGYRSTSDNDSNFGYYLSSSLSDSSTGAYEILFGDNIYNCKSHLIRACGRSVRGVYK
ncbi:MAG: hypothetical protein IKU78_07330 [Paludibacteraceae bacterium]|nr:hypothetical protein [Paludibacteraceae bacterium]